MQTFALWNYKCLSHNNTHSLARELHVMIRIEVPEHIWRHFYLQLIHKLVTRLYAVFYRTYHTGPYRLVGISVRSQPRTTVTPKSVDRSELGVVCL